MAKGERRQFPSFHAGTPIDDPPVPASSFPRIPLPLNFDLNLDCLREVSLRGIVLSGVIIFIRVKQKNVLKSNMQRNLSPGNRQNNSGPA